MLALIFLSFANLALMGGAVIYFLQIREQLAISKQEDERHYRAVEDILYRVMTMDDLEEFFSRVIENAEKIKEVPPEEKKKKWSRWQAAFGGTEEID